jgi:hypothetical protein
MGVMRKKSVVKSRKARPQKARSSEAGTVLWILSIAVAALGVFWLPWMLSSTTPAVGESYVLGFNNRVGVLALGLSILLGTAGCYLGVRRPDACEWFEENPRLFPRWKEARGEYWIFLSISVLTAAVIGFWTSYIVDPSWCEARTGLHGIDLLAVGQVPYRDFMYQYGPALIYFPFWLSKISAGLISFERSFAIFLVVFSIAGFVALFSFLRSLQIPRRGLIAGIAFAAWAGGPSLGIHYTPIRFLVVPGALVLFDAAATRLSAGGGKASILLGLAAMAAVAAGLAISPEMGVSTAAGVFAYGFILLLRRSVSGALTCWLGATLIFAGTLLTFPGYLDSILDFTAGENNFPIYPDLDNLCMVAVSLLTLPPLIASALVNPAQKKAPFALAVAVGGGMLLPVAFGRCDPGHVTYNSLILALVMFPATASIGRIAYRIWIGVFAVLYVILNQVSYWNTYVVNFAEGIRLHDYYRAHPDLVASWKAKWDQLRLSTPHGSDLHWSKVLPYPDGLDQITSKGEVLMTGNCEGNMWLSRYLLLQKVPAHEYFDAFGLGASTPGQIDRRVREDMTYQFLMVPEQIVGLVNGKVNLDYYQQWITTFLSKLFLYPVTSKIKYSPFFPDAEYARRLLVSYKPIGRYQSFIVLEKQDAAPP